MVFEHPGEATFPVSVLVVKKGGMVVICAGTTGYNLTLDARYLWMNQKRVQGSHFANLKQARAANQLMLERRLDPCMSEVFPWAQIPQAHVKMRRNEHKPGNMAVLVSAPTHRASGPSPTPSRRAGARRLNATRGTERPPRRAYRIPVERSPTISILWQQTPPPFRGYQIGEFNQSARPW